MHSLTVTGVVIIAVIVLSCLGGWATSGATRLGREIGFVLGLLTGLVIAKVWLPYVGGRTGQIVLLVLATIGGGLLGAAALSRVGGAVARHLEGAELGSLDRLLGAVLSGIGAIGLCALALHVLVLVNPSSVLLRSSRHDVVAQWLVHNRILMWL